MFKKPGSGFYFFCFAFLCPYFFYLKRRVGNIQTTTQRTFLSFSSLMKFLSNEKDLFCRHCTTLSMHKHMIFIHIFSIFELMYVCIEVALRGDAHGIGHSNWAKGRDPSGSWVQCPNPAVPSIPRHSRWIILMHLSAFSEPTLL